TSGSAYTIWDWLVLSSSEDQFKLVKLTLAPAMGRLVQFGRMTRQNDVELFSQILNTCSAAGLGIELQVNPAFGDVSQRLDGIPCERHSPAVRINKTQGSVAFGMTRRSHTVQPAKECLPWPNQPGLTPRYMFDHWDGDIQIIGVRLLGIRPFCLRHNDFRFGE